MENKIIEKIQKLLRLGESPNQNEAEAAMSKAQELMAKHNIEMQSVTDHDNEYVNNTTENYKRASAESKYINGILSKYFFVQLVRSSRNGYKFLNIVGEKNNVKTAMHMRTYLTNVFKSLWKSYKLETGAPGNSKQSFYWGLYKGFSAKMDLQREAVQKSYDMVLVNDPKVAAKVAELFGKVSQSRQRVNAGDSKAQEAGYQQGKNLNINSGAISA